MKQDFKNVIITFGLIATALISGSFLYRKKIESEYVLAVKQEQLQNLINEQQAILDQLSQQAGTESVVATQSIPTQTLIPAQPTKSKQSPVATPKAAKAIQQPQSTVQSNPVVKASSPAPALTPAPVPPKPKVVTSPTRKSRAS